MFDAVDFGTGFFVIEKDEFTEEMGFAFKDDGGQDVFESFSVVLLELFFGFGFHFE